MGAKRPRAGAKVARAGAEERAGAWGGVRRQGGRAGHRQRLLEGEAAQLEAGKKPSEERASLFCPLEASAKP